MAASKKKRGSIIRQATGIFCLMLAALIAIQCVFLGTYSKTLEEQSMSGLEALSAQYGSSLEYEVETVSTSAISLFRRDEISSVLLGSADSKSMLIAENALNEIMGLNSCIEAVYILDANQNRVLSAMKQANPRPDAAALAESILSAGASLADIPNSYGRNLPSSADGQGLFSYIQPIMYRPGEVMDFGGPAEDPPEMIGYALFICSLQSVKLAYGSDFEYELAVQNSGDTVYCSSQKALDALEDETGDYLCALWESDDGVWTVAASANRSVISAIINRTIITIGTALILVTLLTVISATVLLTKYMLHPIRKLKQGLKNVNPDDPANRLPETPDNEIGEIGAGVNAMLDRLEDANRKAMKAQEEHYKAEVLRRKAELNYLHAQVNPHFLYNSLENICGMAAMGRNDLVIDTCNALAKLFRYSIRKGAVVELEEELKYAENYFYVMNQRYSGVLSLEISASAAARRVKVPKMLLQPLVENALKHGKLDTQQNGRVEIKAFFEGGRFYIRVRDNGVGIPDEEMARLNKNLSSADGELQSDGGLGLYNLCRRLRQQYGPDAAMSITRGSGLTTVEINVDTAWASQ